MTHLGRDLLRTETKPPVHAGAGVHDRPVTYRVEPRRGLQEMVLVYTRAGEAFFRTGGAEFLATPYELVLLHPVHLIEYGPRPPLARWRTYWAHFDIRPAWLSWLEWPQVLPGVFRLRLDHAALRRRIVDRFARVCRLSQRPHPFQSDFLLNAFEAMLLWCRLANPRENVTLIDDRIQRVANFLNDHFARLITLNDLARVALLSPSHLEELFKQQIGTTPFAFLESLRLRQAIHLLNTTNRPVAQVARAVGFDDPLYFSKRFHLRVGTSPRQFRKLGQGVASSTPATEAKAPLGRRQRRRA